MKTDILIIGAGPAGLACAHTLKDSKYSVMLIEKEEKIVNKAFVGGILPTVPIYYLPLRKCSCFDSMYVEFGPFRGIQPFESDAILRTCNIEDIKRYITDKIITAKNIEIRKGVKVIQIKKDHVLLSTNEEIYYRILIGADGMNSIVRKYLNKKEQHICAMYYSVPTVSKIPKIIRSLNTYSYIYWCPISHYTNIGIYYRPMTSKEKALSLLNNHLKENNLNYSNLKLYYGKMNTKYSGVAFNNIYLLGDAAGLSLKIHGEGLTGAILSGEEIGKKILNPNYKMPLLKKYLITYKYIYDTFADLQSLMPLPINLILVHRLSRKTLYL